MAPCLSSIRAERIRVSQLDPAGAPLVGSSSGYISDAQVSVDVGLEIEDGEEIIQKNGGGRLCASFTDVDRVKSATLDVDLCQLDVELLALLTGGLVIEEGANPIGYMPPAVAGAGDAPVCFEVWTRAWEGGAQGVTGAPPEAAYWHFVFPNVKFTPGQFTLDEQTHIFPVSGVSQENPAITPEGPFNDWPPGVVTAGGITRVYGVFLDTAPPAASCGAVAIPASLMVMQTEGGTYSAPPEEES